MTQKTVWLNDVQLPIEGPVTWRRLTPFAAQITSGAQTVDDLTATRKEFWGPLKGGMGLKKWEPGTGDRFWYTENVDGSMNQTALGPLVTTLGSFGATPVKIIKFRDRVWAIGHNQISYWTGSAWTSVKTDLANPTDAFVFYGVG